MLSLAKGIDDWSIFRAWLEGGEWDKKSDWDGSREATQSMGHIALIR